METQKALQVLSFKPVQRKILLACARGLPLDKGDVRKVSSALDGLVLLNSFNPTIYTVTPLGYKVAEILRYKET